MNPVGRKTFFFYKVFFNFQMNKVLQTLFLHSILLTNLSLFNTDAVLCRKQLTPDYIISISIFAFIYMNCTGKMDRIARGRLGILSMVKIKEKKFE